MADVTCGICGVCVGWKYIDARETTQKYKVGRFILEMSRVSAIRGLEDADGDVAVREEEGHEQEKEEEVEFDSLDDEECEELFIGEWDAETVGARRAARAKKMRRKKK